MIVLHDLPTVTTGVEFGTPNVLSTNQMTKIYILIRYKATLTVSLQNHDYAPRPGGIFVHYFRPQKKLHTPVACLSML